MFIFFVKYSWVRLQKQGNEGNNETLIPKEKLHDFRSCWFYLFETHWEKIYAVYLVICGLQIGLYWLGGVRKKIESW